MNRLGQNTRAMIALCLIAATVTCVTGCGSAKTKAKKDEFFTSGSKEADQRASQRMARQEQLSGEGGNGEKKVKEAKTKSSEEGGTNRAAQAEGKLALFDRLGGESGISNIVADFTPRALQDPRVNWDRAGIKQSRSWLHWGKSDTVTWQASPDNVAALKKHMVQFLTLATGGPAHYEGKEMKATHDGMRITNPEFDAAVGDLKASLDRLQIPNKEQKELLAIIESTRPQVVTVR